MTALEKSKALIALLCDRCHEEFPCSLCNLYQFLTGCQDMADGMTPEDAFKNAEQAAKASIAQANYMHDKNTGYQIDAVEV